MTVALQVWGGGERQWQGFVGVESCVGGLFIDREGEEEREHDGRRPASLLCGVNGVGASSAACRRP
jgi:hypothetical protein